MKRVQVYQFILIFAMALGSLHAGAVMDPNRAVGEFGLPASHLSPKSLAERYDELLNVAGSAALYIPDPWTMEPSELCYHLIAAAQDIERRKKIYRNCFYNTDEQKNGPLLAYTELVEEQVMNMTGGIVASRQNHIIIFFAQQLYAQFFEVQQQEKTGASFNFGDMFSKWFRENSNLAFQLSPHQREEVFLAAFLNFTERLQESRKDRKSEAQLKELLAEDIRQFWPEQIEFRDYKKAKDAGDAIGFHSIKNLIKCDLFLKN